MSWPLDGTEAQMSQNYLEHFTRHIILVIVKKIITIAIITALETLTMCQELSQVLYKHYLI